MKFQCINCATEWGHGNPELEGYSHGVCLHCLKIALTPIYRKRQLNEGNFDCFARATGFCDQLYCKYRDKCI